MATTRRFGWRVKHGPGVLGTRSDERVTGQQSERIELTQRYTEIKKIGFIGVFVVVAGVVGWILFVKPSPGTSAVNDDRPNIILIYADDVDCESLFFDWGEKADDPSYEVLFPAINGLARQGMVFKNLHVTTPVCGPSRACLLSGCYAHRNNVRVNDPSSPMACGFSGGFREFDRVHELGHWMKAVGYRTAFVGKYLHDGFSPANGEGWHDLRPEGWDDFFAFLGSRYFDVWVADCLTNVLKNTDAEYRVDAEAQKCIEIIREQTGPNRKPLFLCWPTIASHRPILGESIIAPRFDGLDVEPRPPQLDLYRQLPLRPASLPGGGLPPFSDTEEQDLIQHWQDRLHAIKALDQKLSEIQSALRKTGDLENTIFILTSDHGYELGAHRHDGKRLPNDRVTRVPCIVWGKGVLSGASSDQLLANIDLAPTIVELAGGEVPSNIDGRSFATLLSNPSGALNPPRPAIMIENWEIEKTRGLVVQATYAALRTQNEIYVEWATGEKEFYDFASDPNQVDDLYATLSRDRQSKLAQQLHSLRQVEMQPLVSNSIQLETEIPQRYGEIEISGFAEDDRGIEKIEIEIYDRINKTYWTDEGWAREKTTVAAKVFAERGLISKWQFRFIPGQSSDVPIRDVDLSFSVAVTDVQGNTTWKRDVVSHRFRPGAPESWIDSPTERFLTRVPVILTGRVASVRGVREARVVFRDMVNDLYWDGKEWRDENAYVTLELSPAPEWGENVKRFSYRFDAEIKNDIFIAVRAFDRAGRYDQTPASRTILIEMLESKDN